MVPHILILWKEKLFIQIKFVIKKENINKEKQI